MDGDKDHPCIRVIALRDSEKIRENSALFQDIEEIFFDEFQPETENYVPDEVKRFQSIHTSIARGGKSHVRRVPVYMASNAVSKINPYFIALGIHKKPLGRREYIAGNGWILQQCVIDTAAREQLQSSFQKAFSGDAYTAFSAKNQYLLDDGRFIMRLPIDGDEICVLEDEKGTTFGVWQQKNGLIYVSAKCDPSCRTRVAATRTAHSTLNLVSNYFSMEMKRLYDASAVRFDSPDSYAAFMSMYNFGL